MPHPTDPHLTPVERAQPMAPATNSNHHTATVDSPGAAMPTKPTTAFPPPLAWPRLQRLGYTVDAAILTGAAILAGIGLTVTITWPRQLLPSFAAHGPRHWITCAAVGVILAIGFDLIGNHLDTERHPRRQHRPAAGGYGTKLALTATALAAVTTQPVWGQLAALWASNNPHAAPGVVTALAAHLAPALAVLAVGLAAPALLRAYRGQLQRQQHIANETAGETTPGPARLAVVTNTTTEARPEPWSGEERELLDQLRDTLADGLPLAEPPRPAVVLGEAIDAIRIGDHTTATLRTELDQLRTQLTDPTRGEPDEHRGPDDTDHPDT